MSQNLSHAPQFDTGPLSWVIEEIRDALGRSDSALLEAAEQGAQAPAVSLQHARTHLHQAHGALQMVDVEGVGAVTEAAEQAIDRFKDGTLECGMAQVQVVAEAYQSVVEYLEELLTGASQQPVRLFPYYRALREMLGAGRIHPADLFFADLSGRVTLPGLDGAAAVPDYAACRARFEKALLPFLKNSEVQAQGPGAQALQDAIAEVAAGQEGPDERVFWFAMHSFAQLVASGQLPADRYVKQLFGLINLQIRRLSQGQGSLPEAMMRDALFFIASIPNPPAAAQLLRRAYRLEGKVPSDYDTRRYGRIDPAALKTARDALAQAKLGWGRLASDIDADLERAFADALSVATAASEQLDAPALPRLLHAVASAARDSVASGRHDQFVLEVATALLFVEHGLDQVRQLPPDFEARAGIIGTRLLALAAGQAAPAAPEWQGDLSRQIEQGRTVAVLAAEMASGLRQVEKILDDYDADPARRATLAQIDKVLHQLQGALAVLDQDHAMRAAQHVREAVAELAAAEGNPELEAASLQNIAQNVGALGFFIDMLAQNVDGARNRFSFDQATGMFREVPFESWRTDDRPFEPEAQAASAPPAEPETPASALPAGGEASVEAELLEIFISEAQEVLGVVGTAVPELHAAPSNQETLATLRRAFHTLKGSGRMVGLDQFADAGAAIERVMNRWLSEARAATPDLLALLERASVEMGAWVDELVTNGVSRRDSEALVAAAERVQHGGAFAIDEEEVGEVIDMTMPDERAQLSAPPAAGNVIGFPKSAARPAAQDDNIKRIGELEIALPLYNIYLAETDELVRLLDQDFGEWRHEPQRAVTPAAMTAAHTLAGTSATVGFTALREVAHSLEMALTMLEPPAPVLDDEQRAVLDATIECVRAMLRLFALGELAPHQPAMVLQLNELRDGLALRAAASELANVDADLAPQLDALFAATLEGLLDAPPVLAQSETAPAAPAAEQVDDMFDSGFDDAFDAPTLDQAAPPPLDDAPPLPDFVVPEAAAAAAAAPAPAELAGVVAFTDELDPDLLPVFLEEGRDLLPEIGKVLRTWQQDPADSGQAQMLLRSLHTVKGSARMAGAMRLGQHAHEIETQIENMVHAGTTTPAAFDELLGNYDHALALFEQLQVGAQATAPEDPHAAQARTPLVRVRADILDRLVNQAGEVSITRSKLENQVGSLKASLFDFSDNLARLRRQLREVEMQAESQIASRMSIASEREFDPLEFDRFTRLQELTRMMAESVNDVASFHDSLTRTVEAATDDLNLQSRLTRDLQRDLMRVRMVPFASLSERLFRVARQTAKEVDKRVNLDIRGGAVEIDRSVLEQMAAPFEHLLRNAIVHGIEARTVRGAGGKAETGELLVQVSQQGNEVVIQFSDDGAGLNLDKIRAKALSAGLIVDPAIADAEAADLIFEPGFSTADALTSLAGRGVGMDVVRSVAQSLGGRVAIGSEAGKGACFTIHLPLTLAVTQVVLTTSGNRTYALPSTLVEQVLQMKEAALSEAHAAGAVQYQGHGVALHYLPTLLGDPGARPLAQRSCPVLILKNGADRIAVQVDDVQGNREVVVKNIGPQLSRMIGISGATVLGSGDIVLILNPVALAHHLAHHPGLRPHFTGVAPALDIEPRARDVVIMVVDDSLTVRRVTQRLLEREGYQVMLAKDGVDALEQLQERMPDLMLVDIEMPRMDGFDLTRNIRGSDSTGAIPIIMITSRTADKHRNYALELGVNAYFGKPFQEEILLAAITGLLGQEVVPGP